MIAAAADALPGELSQTAAGDADYKIALLQRTAKSSFMPDVMVFPGGSVDAQDAAVAESLIGDTAVASVTAVAACREAFEESGIIVAEDAVALVSKGVDASRYSMKFVWADGNKFLSGQVAREMFGIPREQLPALVLYVKGGEMETTQSICYQDKKYLPKANTLIVMIILLHYLNIIYVDTRKT